MTKTKNTKRALLASILAMMLCVVMLIGSTFAWFSDTASSGRNSIVAGVLDVELYHTNAKVPAEQKVDADTKLFVDVNGEDVLWEPGAMVYESFIVKNEGTLALKYTLSLNIADFNTVTVDGEVKSLKDVLKVAIVDDDVLPATITREYAKGLNFAYTIEDFEKSGEIVADGADKKYGIVIYWEDSDNDNDYNLEVGEEPLYIDLGVTLVATQAMDEEDNFGKDYDANATYPASPAKAITNGDALLAASSKESSAPISIQLANDITDSKTVIAVAEDSTVNVDFAGNTLTITDDTIPAVLGASGATITLSNGTIIQDSTATVQLFSNDENGAPAFIAANGGSIFLRNMTVETESGRYVVSTGENGLLHIVNSTLSGNFDVSDGTLMIVSGYFTVDPTDYLYDKNSCSVETPGSEDDFWKVEYVVDEGDIDDPFGDE